MRHLFLSSLAARRAPSLAAPAGADCAISHGRLPHDQATIAVAPPRDARSIGYIDIICAPWPPSRGRWRRLARRWLRWPSAGADGQPVIGAAPADWRGADEAGHDV